ncbi:MAG: cytochrome c oxidase assembly protein, partial [Nocardioidaceae bacterium]
RYSTLALACFVAVACSGVLNAWIRTSGELSLWVGSGYGALVAIKICALVGLGYLGWMHRRHTLRALAAGRPGVFARLATVEVVLMAATVAVAVALSRTPPPAGTAVEVPGHGAGHPTLGSDIAPFTLTRLFTEWRVEAISLAVVVVAAACYAAGLRRLSRNGVAWPPQHTAAAAAATAAALLATSGGLGTYSTAAFSVQVAQFLALFVVVPVLVGLSAPVTLAAYASAHPREDDPDGWLPAMTQSRAGVWLSDPLNMLIVAAVTLFGMYGTPLLEASLRSAPLHLAVNLVTLVVGVVFWWSVLGADPAVELRARRYRLWVLGGFLVLLGAVGARIYLSDVLLAGAWFTDLGWAWLDPVVDQRRGAGLMWACVLVLGPVLAALTHVSPRPRLPSARPDPALRPVRRR